ncbi:MAG TPA: COX15/CtaA family protein [Verrucomicrobiae bacterium]|nr:COX15/CtaA family protein [Verrucomicrobiae bacterium]
MSENVLVKLNRPLHWFAVLTALFTFLLLGAGGLVTSHEAGMSVPDWPNSYGYNMFLFPPSKWIGGIFYEHTHRLMASGVGLMTTILALWLFGRNARPFMRWMGLILPILGIASEILFPNRWLDGVLYGATGFISYVASFFWPSCERSVRWMRWLGVAAFLLVVVQGVLGGLRVVLADAQLGIFHAIAGQSFFVLTAAIALFTSRWWQNLRPDRAGAALPAVGAHGVTRPVETNLRTLVLFTTVLIFCQLIIGATMRQQHAGLAIPDFPLAYGKIWPDTSPAAVQSYNEHRMNVIAENAITAPQIILQMIHRLVALAIFFLTVTCAWQARRQLGKTDSLAKLAWFWLGLILAQILLGAATIWSNKAADVATAHVLGGALSLVTGALWCAIAFRRSAALPEIAPAATISGAFGGAPAMAANK